MHLPKIFKSSVIDFLATGYMITAQLFSKTKLDVSLLNQFMNKITNSVQTSLYHSVALLLSLMFQTQTEELIITDNALENIINFKWFPSALEQMRNEGKPFIALYLALISKLLQNIGEKTEDFAKYTKYFESLMAEVVLDDDEAQIIIRCIIDSYTHVPAIGESANQTKKLDEKVENSEFIITLDSDDEDNIPLKPEDVTFWYSAFLHNLERSYPNAFDKVVKDVMSRTPGRKQNGLKNVLGFLLRVSCANNDTNIFENLYHHNAEIRTEAVAYLVRNFEKISLDNNENKDILKLTIAERLNDDNPKVLAEILNIKSSQLIELIGVDELVAKLSKVLMRYWKCPEKWHKVCFLALRMLTSENVFKCSDSNIVHIAVLPFLFSLKFEFIQIIKDSKYGKTTDFIKEFSRKHKDYISSLTDIRTLPSSESILETIERVLLRNEKIGSFSIQFAFLLLATAIEDKRAAKFSLKLIEIVIEVLSSRKLQLANGEVADISMLGRQEIPTKIVAEVFKKVIKNTKFDNSTTIDFSNLNNDMKLKLKIFQYLVTNFFNLKVASEQRMDINGVIKTFLDTICKSDHLMKLEFFSQFCASHVVFQDNDGTSLELQIKTMKLLNNVLRTNQEHVGEYSNEFFQHILISLTAEQTIIREFGMEIFETLYDQNVSSIWKFVIEKLITRKSEILIDDEQMSLIFFLLASKKSSANFKRIIESIITTIEDKETLNYIRSSLLMILKHLNDKKVLDVMSKIGMEIITSSDADDFHRFDDFQSIILKLVLLRINSSTMSYLWALAIKSLDCHRLMFNEDGKYLTPSFLVLKNFDEDFLTALHADQRMEVIQKTIKCSMKDQPKLVQAAHKIFNIIQIDCKITKTILMKMPQLELRIHAKNKKNKPLDGVSIDEGDPLKSDEWKFGVTLLELLQNKSKGLSNEHELIPILFNILDNCSRASIEMNVEFVRQIVLSLLLMICQKTSPDGKSHQRLGVRDQMLRTELVVKCIKESENPQTHHHSLLLLSHLALMTPNQVLNDMMTIFTFVGTTLVRHEDSYSFQIISKVIENVVPALIHKKYGDDEIIPILKIFTSILLQVPDHRRLMLYVKLLTILNVEKFLWVFIGLVIESQVVNHKKGMPNDELPQRIQIALAITKEFDVRTILDASTSLIVHLKELPMFIENKPHTRAINVEDVNVIFNLKTHSDFQLRHFKYLVLQFLKNLLSSPEVSLKVSRLSYEMKLEMKREFQAIILNMLTLIPEISKAINHQKMKSFEKSWHAILQNAFDILEASIELLAPDMLLVVVGNLFLHEFLLVRKKIIELLNRKLEDDYFNECNDEKMLKLIKPLKNICETIGNESNTALEVVQQSTLISIKLLARKLCDDHPEEFIEILDQLTGALDNNEKIKTPVMMNLVICIADLMAMLKVKAIGKLGKFMPNLLKLMTLEDDDSSAFFLLYSVVSAQLKIIETVPMFLSPYLVQIITQLTRLSPGLKLLTDGKIHMLIGKISKTWTSIAQLVPLRVLVPVINEVYHKIIEKQHFDSIKPLMELMFEMFQNIESKELRKSQTELTDFFLNAMQIRCEVEGKNDIEFEKVNDIEDDIIKALVALVMKLSEGSFRPLFENIFNWALRDHPDNYNRAIAFFRFTTHVSASLKSLFLLFASDLIDCAAPILDKCHSSDACFNDNDEKNLYLLEFILKTLHNIFLHDHQNFINTQRFDVIMQPIVDQIDNRSLFNNDGLQELVKKCVAQLAVAASDDILWKQLNYQVLMKTRAENPNKRIFGVKVCIEMAKKLGEDFEPLVPETIPFLSELLEDEDYEVVEACQQGVRELEKTVGESLQKYL
ncbi:CLUMA_CG015914, isoform A [Clunio marinus]|uniref:HEAT repeat-containing protein 1 n=1 Tax=Clunio marinus TaxID=568069 RepID=A0A1J1IVS7_9DIPT|nr:CLUMA_CG015914, isoform A [Clunio marinus]